MSWNELICNTCGWKLFKAARFCEINENIIKGEGRIVISKSEILCFCFNFCKSKYIIVDLVLILNQPFFIIRLWVSMRFYKRHVHTVTNQCRNNNKLRKSNITTSITMSAIQHDIHLYWMNTCYTNTNALFSRVNVCAARNNKSIHI